MSEHALTVRLDTSFESDRQAWNRLRELQQGTHLSCSKIITDAVNAYDTVHTHLAPEDETRLVGQITDAVAERMQQMLPAYLAGYSAGTASHVAAAPVTTTPCASNTANGHDHSVLSASEDTEPDFNESIMDFDFMGGF